MAGCWPNALLKANEHRMKLGFRRRSAHFTRTRRFWPKLQGFSFRIESPFIFEGPRALHMIRAPVPIQNPTGRLFGLLATSGRGESPPRLRTAGTNRQNNGKPEVLRKRETRTADIDRAYSDWHFK